MRAGHPLLLLAATTLLAACPQPDDDDSAVGDDDDALVCDDGWILVGRACIEDWDDDWAQLTEGVDQIDSGGWLPSSFVVHGPSAFPVVLDEGNRAFVVASRHGAGRAVVFGHEGFLGGALDGEGDGVGRLIHNAVGWVGGGDGTIGLTSAFGGLQGALDAEGFATATVAPDALDDVDVLVVESWNSYDEATLAGIADFVADGGGLLAGGHAWYWAYDGGNSATEYSGSRMLKDAGLTWTPYGHVTAGIDVVPSEPPSLLLHARAALESFIEHTDGVAELELDEQVLGASSASLALDVLPLAGFPDYFERARLLADTVGAIVVSEAEPLVRAERPIDEVVVWIDLKYARELPADQVWTHEGFTDFPGDVPEGAPTVSATVSIDGDHDGLDPNYGYSGATTAALRSTGVYAAPGELLTVEIPAAMTGAGLLATIGPWTDGLQGSGEWWRYPVLTRSYELTSSSTPIASAFGGPVYVRVPTGAQLGDFEVTVDGGVEMPWFVLGETSDWPDRRDAPAPWAELTAPGRIVLTVPSEHVRDLDAQPLMELWEAVLDADAEVSGFDPDARPRAERFVTDRQISAGWMHSGYPIMAHLVSAVEVTDLASLTSVGAWGPFHELGHNHQWRPWVLPGTTEATVNIFSVYVSEEVLGIDRGDAHSALSDASREQRTTDYLAGGADFWSDWSVWTALETYLLLQEAFGWEPFTQVFAEYRGLSGGDVPGTDQERIDQWAVRFAAAVDRDLGPFFEAWGFPLSAWAIEQMETRPAWDEDPMLP
jgi:hypothetical protein